MSTPKCSASMCRRDGVSWTLPYCPDHVPIGSFVTKNQLATAWMEMKKGRTLYQAAKRADCDPRDLDVALWYGLGQPKPAAVYVERL